MNNQLELFSFQAAATGHFKKIARSMMRMRTYCSLSRAQCVLNRMSDEVFASDIDTPNRA
jgi:uncharacterized protein YjiS (DUF1127 family)